MSTSLLQIDDLGYRYSNGHVAVSGLSLDLGPGILGLLGPNGAGKSSLMRVLATLSKATSGRVLWKGQDIVQKPDALRVELGYLPQDFGVYPALSAREFLGFLAAVKGLSRKATVQRVQQCLEQVGLTDAADKPLSTFSGGMRQRVGIAQALLNDPQLLIVDEPTVGLDPEERMRFRHLLTELADHRLIILSTHIVSDQGEAAFSRYAGGTARLGSGQGVGADRRQRSTGGHARTSACLPFGAPARRRAHPRDCRHGAAPGRRSGYPLHGRRLHGVVRP